MGVWNFLKKDGPELTSQQDWVPGASASNGRIVLTLVSYERNTNPRCHTITCSSKDDCFEIRHTKLGTRRPDFSHSIVLVVMENLTDETIDVDNTDFRAIDTDGFPYESFHLCDYYHKPGVYYKYKLLPHSKTKLEILFYYSDKPIKQLVFNYRQDMVALNFDNIENVTASDAKDEIIHSLQEEIAELKQQRSQRPTRWEPERQLKYEIVEDEEYYRVISKEEQDTVSFNREFDKSKDNHNWININDPLITMRLDNTPQVLCAPTMISSPVPGIFEFDSNKLIPFGAEICRIKKYPQESKQEIIEQFEREEIRQAVMKKERKKQIERETLDELIRQGLVFNTYTKKDGNRTTIPMDVASAVWNRDGGRCCMCGSREELEFDHIIPLSKGGATTFRNLQLLCKSCNIRKSDNI